MGGSGNIPRPPSIAESIGSLRLYVQPKIFKQLGGFAGIKEIWLDFFKKCRKHPILNSVYQLDNKTEDRIEFLSKKYTFFLVNQTGGQVDWSGLQMNEQHAEVNKQLKERAKECPFVGD